jgi:hypothetical protein
MKNSEAAMSVMQKIIGTGILYLLTTGLGIWLSHSGRPLNAALSAVHKLVALGTVVVTVLLFVNILKGVRLETVLLALFIIAGACVAALIATGAILSGAKSVNQALLIVHNAATALAVLSLAGAAYLALK